MEHDISLRAMAPSVLCDTVLTSRVCALKTNDRRPFPVKTGLWAPGIILLLLLIFSRRHTHRVAVDTVIASYDDRGTTGGGVGVALPTGFHGSAATRRGRPTGNLIRAAGDNG